MPICGGSRGIYGDCVPTITTPYVFRFDISDTSTIFQDTACTTPAVNIGDPVRGWKATSDSYKPITATLTGTPVPVLASFSTGKQCLWFNKTGAYFTFTTKAFTDLIDATLIYVMSAPTTLLTTTYSQPPFQTSYGWYCDQYSHEIYETFYVGASGFGREKFTPQSYNVGPTVIYAVVASGTTAVKSTKCYAFDKTNSALISLATLVYYNNTTINTPYAGGKYFIGGFQGNCLLGIAEIMVLPTALSESVLLTKMIELRTKWNF